MCSHHYSNLSVLGGGFPGMGGEGRRLVGRVGRGSTRLEFDETELEQIRSE